MLWLLALVPVLAAMRVLVLDEATLRKIALITEGSYFKASSAEELRSLYHSISTAWFNRLL